jgi:hypothetical protein
LIPSSISSISSIALLLYINYIIMNASDRSSRGVERQDYLKISKKGLPSKPTSTQTPKPNPKPKTNTDPNPGVANPPNAGVTSETVIDPNIDPNTDPNTDPNIDPNFNATEPNNGGRAPSITLSEFSDTFDDGTPFEPLRRQRPSVEAHSWVFNWFEVVVLHSELYIPKGAIGQKTDRRLNCKLASCNWFVMDSKRGGSTGNLSRHLATHGITKNRAPSTYTRTIPDMFNNISNEASKASVSAEQSVINWVVDTLAPFTSVEQESFQQMFVAHGNRCVIRTANVVKDRIMAQYNTYIERLRAELESTCSTVSLTWDGWTSPNQVPVFAVIIVIVIILTPVSYLAMRNF